MSLGHFLLFLKKKTIKRLEECYATLKKPLDIVKVRFIPCLRILYIPLRTFCILLMDCNVI